MKENVLNRLVNQIIYHVFKFFIKLTLKLVYYFIFIIIYLKSKYLFISDFLMSSVINLFAFILCVKENYKLTYIFISLE